MLSDEEKQAIQYYKECNEKDLENYEYLGDVSKKQAKYLELLLNLIKKQSKEIEELKEYKHDAELTKVACCTAQNCEALNNCIKLERELQNADNKWEDKIKAKIEELEKLDFGTDLDFETDLVSQFTANLTTITILQSLLNKEE